MKAATKARVYTCPLQTQRPALRGLTSKSSPQSFHRDQSGKKSSTKHRPWKDSGLKKPIPRPWTQKLSNTGSKLASRLQGDAVSLSQDPIARLRQNIKQEYFGRHAVFRSAVLVRFAQILNTMDSETPDTISMEERYRQTSKFLDQIDHAFQLAESGVTRRDKNPLFWNLRDAFTLKDVAGLEKELRFNFQSLLVQQRMTKSLQLSQKQLLDFRYPMEWFPATRALQRKIHVHVGPTNSGKTYRALKALGESKCGVYAGPLRLLATEVFQRFTAQGVSCALLTGEEVRIPADTDQYHTSCTVEMVPLNRRFDVAVIDEIQMLGDPSRGSAWTNALLGVQADEVHVCGEERTVNLLQKICASIGDECIVHRYQRLSPLKTMEDPVSLDQLEKGDAVVAFSRKDLHALKTKIERRTKKRCAIVYGTLPPEVRAQQAALFNDPTNDYDFIVASDAIGMGLNLEIRRVVFESVSKFDGTSHRLLSFPEVKQIGGRAGRYRSSRSVTHAATDSSESADKEAAEEKMGYVTCVERQDLQSIHRAFRIQPRPIEAAVIEPPVGLIEKFSAYFPPKTPLSFILMRIKSLATVSELYRLNIDTSRIEIADLIQDIDLDIYDRLTLCNLPVNIRSESGPEVLRALARVISTKQGGDFLDIPSIPLEALDQRPEDYMYQGKRTPQDYLHNIEFLHNAINMYLWLSYRYANLFRDQKLAFHTRELVEEKLMDSLEKLDYTDRQLAKRRVQRRNMAVSRQERKKKLGPPEVDSEGEPQEYAESDPPLDDGVSEDDTTEMRLKLEAQTVKMG